MHNVRSENDKRKKNTIQPSTKALGLQKVSKFGIESVFEGVNTDWTRVVTNPRLFCKSKLF